MTLARNTNTGSVRRFLADVVADELEALDPPLLDPTEPDPDDPAELLPLTYTVLPFGDDLGEVHEPAILVELQRVEPGSPPPLREHTLAVHVVEPRVEPGVADDRLDALLSGVLDVLAGLSCCEVQAAQRGTYLGRLPAYTITLTMKG